MTDNLPKPSAPFIGRAAELTEIADLLAEPSCRLLTLVGPGGIGKTRLATQAAPDQREAFSDGVYFVPLTPVASSSMIPEAIASTLQVTFHSVEDPRLQIIRFLREKHLLLVLDNFEHLLAGVDLLTDILHAAAGVKLLVTSRERLNVQEEWALVLDGLRFPADQPNMSLESYSCGGHLAYPRRQKGFALGAD